MPNPPTRGYVARLGSGLVPTKCRRLAPALAAVALVAACTGDPVPPASGDPDGTSLVIAVAGEPAELNPLDGYAENGAAKIFEGLVEHDADSSLRPALAVDLPQPAPDGRTWTVKLRPDVTFTDGTPFEAADVVATYQAMLSPARRSPVRQRFSMLKSVTAVDQATVEFTLTAPYAPFPELLVLGILPSESLTGTGSAEPIGTGPYRLTDWQRGSRMELEANKDYWDGPPAIKNVTIEFIPDDDSRAERMREGKLDGAALPPALAADFDNTDGLRVVSHSAADVRAVVLPTDDPVTGDPAVRIALNHAMNREQMVNDVLAGQGSAAFTPMPTVLAEFVEPDARFGYDITRALDKLESGGWVTGADGIRTKGGTVARFTLRYPVGDSVAAGLAEAFATNARSVGVQVDLAPVSADAQTEPAVVGFGDPFDPDLALYSLLRSGKGALGGYADETVDAALDVGRAATDPAQRATAYRRLQRTYVGAPGLVVLTEPNHTYVIRETWDGYEPVVDASGASMSWGAWWNLEKWTPR